MNFEKNQSTNSMFHFFQKKEKLPGNKIENIYIYIYLKIMVFGT